MENRNSARKHIILAAISALMLAVLIAGCSLTDFSWGFSGDSAETGIEISEQSETSESDKTQRSSYFVDIKPGQTDTDDETGNEGTLDDISDQMLYECISADLDNFSDEIDLTACLSGFRIEEGRVDELINKIVDVFEHKYMQDPFVFYLNGSIQVGYELQSGWGSRYLTSMKLKLQMHEKYSRVDITELEKIKADMLAEAQAIVDLAGDDRSDWEKLLVVHDELVRRISYDTSLNQSNNQAASALIDNYSLCKGYAQSFKLICDLMSIECEVISGQAEGIEHAWNLVYLDGQPYHIDVTHDDPVPDRGSSGPVDHRHFLRSDDVMASTHQWKRDDYNTAEHDGAHYFQQNDLVASDLAEVRDKLQKFLLLSDFNDDRDDQLELLYDGSPEITQEELETLFKEALAGSSLNRRFSYQASADKNVIQLIIIAG